MTIVDVLIVVGAFSLWLAVTLLIEHYYRNATVRRLERLMRADRYRKQIGNGSEADRNM